MADTNILPTALQNLTWLDFHPEINCALAGQCLGGALRVLEDESSPSVPDSLVDFARASAPVILANISHEQILEWNSFVLSNKNISVVNLTDITNQKCHLELCQNLKFEGNPDISGIGVSFSLQNSCQDTPIIEWFLLPTGLCRIHHPGCRSLAFCLRLSRLDLQGLA